MEFSSDQFDSKVDSIPEFSSHNNGGFNIGTQNLQPNTNNYTYSNSTNNTDMVSDVNNISNQGLNNLSDKMNEMGEELID